MSAVSIRIRRDAWWSTFARLWLGYADPNRPLTRVAAHIGRTGLGWFGQAETLWGLTGLVVVVAFLLVLVGLAYSRVTRTWGPEMRAWLWDIRPS